MLGITAFPQHEGKTEKLLGAGLLKEGVDPK
jgi:hypothetical protein